jgi:hypothetical protein
MVGWKPRIAAGVLAVIAGSALAVLAGGALAALAACVPGVSGPAVRLPAAAGPAAEAAAPRAQEPGDWPPPAGEVPPPAEPDNGEPPAEEPPREDVRQTAGGALRYFMASRDYRTLRDLRSAMTAGLRGRFEHDSTPFCGKRGIRLAAFDFAESDLKPVVPRTARTAGAQPPAAVQEAFTASVRTLWEEQGEAVEMRTETARVTRGEDGLWRVSDLQRAAADRLRFAETIDGVTTLRIVLRAWRRGDAEAARPHLSESFLKRHQAGAGGPDGLLAVGEGGPRRAAYQIVEVRPAPDGIIARVRLFFAPAGQPARLEGEARALRLVKKGPKFLLDAWQ